MEGQRFSEGEAVPEKFQRKPVDRAGIGAWALRRGFQENDDGMLVAPYRESEIQLVLTDKSLKTTWVANGEVIWKLNGRMSVLFIDQFDMLHGAGLFSNFYSLFRENGVRPVWFSDELITTMEKAEQEKGKEPKTGHEVVKAIVDYVPRSERERGMDGLDAKGMIRIAWKGLSGISEDDEFRPVLVRVAEIGIAREQFDVADAEAIVAICTQALDDAAALPI